MTLTKYIGDKAFYNRASRQILPIIIQSFVTSLSGFIDTIMASHFDGVSAVGTALQIDALMQGVTFGIAAGINIFVVQYYGAKDLDKMKQSFVFSLLMVSLNSIVWIVLSLFLNVKLLGLFIADENVVVTSYSYLRFSCFSFVFTSLIMSFSFAYHSVQKTIVPFIIGSFTLVIHVAVNYLLMFVFGMGISGAGLSMVITQALSFLVYVIYSYKTRQPFMASPMIVLKLRWPFMRRILIKTMPLIFNETLFSFGNSLFIVAYGTLGKKVMDCYYIGNQVVNIAYTVVNGISDGATTLIGYELGRKNYDYVEKEVNYFFGLTGAMSVITILFLVVMSPVIVGLFSVNDPASYNLSVGIIRVLSLRVAFRLFNVIIFAALRSGGDSKFLALLDSGILWLVGVGSTFIMIYIAGITDIVLVILISQLEQLVRLVIGLKRIKSRKWLQSLT